MCLKCDITEKLGINKKEISDKSADFAKYLLESKIFGKGSPEGVLEYMDENFSIDELKVLAISFIMVKTQETLEEMTDEGNPMAKAMMMGMINLSKNKPN